MEFNTRYNRKFISAPERNSGETLVETAGYMPSKARIEALMTAGIRLKEFRMEQFDFHENQVDESYFDRTRSKNFDLADFSQMRRELEERSRQKIKERKKAVADKMIKDSQTHQEASGKASEEKEG